MIDRIVRRWADACLTYRKTVLLAVVTMTVVTAARLPDARFDNALDVWFLEDDPALVAHQELVDTFGSDEMIVVGVEAPDVFDPHVIAAIDRMTRAIAEAPHIQKVFSLTDIESISGRDDVLEVAPLLELPLEPGELERARRRAFESKLYAGNVVSATGDFAAIIARIPHHTSDFEYKIEAVVAVREILDRESGDPGFTLHMSGAPTLDERFFVLSELDSQRVIPLMLVLLVVALWLLLRSATGVLVPLATVSIATTWAIGAIVIAGARINVITTMLPPLLLAVGVADSMHFLVDYQSRCARGIAKLEALRETYRELALPIFLTSLTTAIGMLSLCISRVEGIREFGFFAALGVAGAFLLSVSFVPVALSYAPVPRPRRSRPRRSLISSNALEAVHRTTMSHGSLIVAGSIVLITLALVGASQVRVESLFLEIFPDDEPVKIATRRIEDALAGTVTLDVTVDTGRADGIKDPEILRHVERLQTFLESDPEVSSSQSIADYFKEMRRAMFGGDPNEMRLPQSREEAAQYLLLYEMDAPDGDIREYATFDYRKTRVSARIDLVSSNEIAALVARTDRWIAENFPKDLRASTSGMAVLYTNMEEYVRASLVRGFSIALVAIFVVFCLQMRSIVLGSIAMIPNVAPIVLGLGVMGFAGIRLDSMTSMVASIAIGLAVDDSIHFVSRVRLFLGRGRPMREALRETTVEIGRAIIYTSLVLCGGFSVMLIAHFVGMVYFGMLCLLTILFALTADLLLLPVVLRWYGERTTSTVLEPATVETSHLGRIMGDVASD